MNSVTCYGGVEEIGGNKVLLELGDTSIFMDSGLNFDEEAQLYITKSLWDDILTRMRHYGIFPTFITNDPRTLPDEVYSLCDNLVSFSFHNEDDLKQLSKAKMIDLDTFQILQSIEFQSALMIGNITDEFPILVDIGSERNVMMGGETEELF